jgi:hypothetical protein
LLLLLLLILQENGHNQQHPSHARQQVNLQQPRQHSHMSNDVYQWSKGGNTDLDSMPHTYLVASTAQVLTAARSCHLLVLRPVLAALMHLCRMRQQSKTSTGSASNLGLPAANCPRRTVHRKLQQHRQLD